MELPDGPKTVTVERAERPGNLYPVYVLTIAGGWDEPVESIHRRGNDAQEYVAKLVKQIGPIEIINHNTNLYLRS